MSDTSTSPPTAQEKHLHKEAQLEAIHPEPPDWKPLRHPWRAVFLTLAAMAATLAIAEAVARASIDPLRMEGFDFFVLDADVGWRFPANQRQEGLEWFGTHYDHLVFPTNNRGIRGTRDYPAPHQPDEIRVMALGDSTVNNMHFDGYPEYLEVLLESAVPSKDFWVQNAGVNGFSTLNARFFAEEEIPRFEPDYVLITVGTDDALITDRQDIVDYQVEDFGGLLARAGQHSRLVLYLHRTLPRWLVTPITSRPTQEDYLKADKKETRTTPEQAEENYAAIVETARDEGAHPWLVLQPKLVYDKSDLHLGAPYRKFSLWNQALWNAAQATNTEVIDGIELFDRPDRAAFFLVHEAPSDADKWHQQYGMYPDPLHLNHAGNRLLATAFARQILEEIRKKNPEMAIDYSLIEEWEAELSETPTPSEGFLNGVPTPELFQHLKELEQKANADENPKPWERE